MSKELSNHKHPKAGIYCWLGKAASIPGTGCTHSQLGRDYMIIQIAILLLFMYIYIFFFPFPVSTRSSNGNVKDIYIIQVSTIQLIHVLYENRIP